MKTLKDKINIGTSWKKALASWNHPAIPQVIVPKAEEMEQLGEIGAILQGQLAFMKYPEFQTYANLENIVSSLQENPQRGLDAIMKHEAGHRFCPYDIVTMLILNHTVTKALEGKVKEPKAQAHTVMNLYTDMCLNTLLVQQGDQDIPWAYQQLSKDKTESRFWKVYGKSMELAWKKEILPQNTSLNQQEIQTAEALSKLFESSFFDKTAWKYGIEQYAQIMSPFLEEPPKKRGKGKGKGQGTGRPSTGFDDMTSNIPKTLDERTKRELAKRLAEIGSNGLPKNPQGMKEYKEMMAGFEQGDPVKASIEFYDMLSNAYEVSFATRPFGKQKLSPFQPTKWYPSMSIEQLDIYHSLQEGGRLIPGVNTYAWNNRRRETYGLEEIIPNLDIYIDSSGTMPNPVEEISLPVLSGFVVAKKAHRKGAKIRATNFSGEGQFETQKMTRELYSIFKKLVTYFNGGTVFPTEALLEVSDPKQAIIITDTFLGNTENTAQAISELRKRNPKNKVTIYAIHQSANGEQLRSAGAEVIYGTSTDIFKKVIGKADEVYVK